MEARPKALGKVSSSQERKSVVRKAAPAPAMATEGDRAQLIDGKAIAATIRGEIKDEIDRLRSETGGEFNPGLAVVLVGERKDSQTYVRNKKRRATTAEL